MKPVKFKYVAPESLEGALQALQDAGFGGKVLAGGQSLVPMMNFRLARPEVIVDLNKVGSLAGIRLDGESVVIGAMTRHQTIAEHADLARWIPVMATAAQMIGHWAIRSRGTIGGSLAHADPASEWPAVLTALDAQVRVASAEGNRDISVRDLILGPLTTSLAPEELITEIRVALPGAGVGFGIDEVARRPGDFAMVGAVAKAESDAAEWTWFGLGTKPERKRIPEYAQLSPGDRHRRLTDVVQALDPASDLQASAEWRRQVAVTVAERAYEQARGKGGR